MKRILILATALAAMTAGAFAQDYDMVVEDASGGTTTFRVENIDSVRICFDTWTAVAKGDYAYTVVSSDVATGLELFQSDAQPTRWKIGNWGGGVDLYFDYDEETGDMCVDRDQETGLTYRGEDLFVCEKKYLSGAEIYGASHHDPGSDTFTFFVAYYSETYKLGATGADDRPESFTVTEWYK